MTLAMMRPGERAIVKAVHGGRMFNQRLATIGLTPQSEVKLIKGGLDHPVIVEVRGTRFMIGRGMAHRVIVEPVT